MNTDVEQNDTDRVGLNEETRIIFDEIMADNHFRHAMDAYRLAAALAISEGIDISDHRVRWQSHMFLRGQIDPDNILSNLIASQFPLYTKIQYRALERFADKGVFLLKKRIDDHGALFVRESG